MTARAALASLLAATCAACGSGVTVGGPSEAASSADLARAALTFSSVPAPGKACMTNEQLSFPSTDDMSVFAELDDCDLSMGCKPDELVAVDREHGASVSCTVAPSDDRFEVRLTLEVDGSATSEPSVRFSAMGLVSETGGMVAVSESNSVSGDGSQTDCVLTIAPPVGVIGRGKIWASFECSAFTEQNLADSGCILRGKLLFENCDS